MNDDQYFLANAYVDGELTADERRLAESDPDVMSEVGLLSALHDQLLTVEPPTVRAREAAIAAAMSEFGTVSEHSSAPAVGRSVPSATRAEFRRRTWSTRYLGIAAGLVAIGLLGTVVVSSLRAGGDDDAASEPLTDADATAFSVEEADSDRILETQGDLEATADDAAGTAAAELAPATEQPTAEPAEAMADEPAADSDGSPVDSTRPKIDPDEPLTTPAELGAYGSYLIELQQADQLPPTPNTKCTQPGILGATQYLFDNVPGDVLIAVDDAARSTTAIDPDTCQVLVVGPLF